MTGAAEHTSGVARWVRCGIGTMNMRSTRVIRIMMMIMMMIKMMMVMMMMMMMMTMMMEALSTFKKASTDGGIERFRVWLTNGGYAWDPIGYPICTQGVANCLRKATKLDLMTRAQVQQAKWKAIFKKGTFQDEERVGRVLKREPTICDRIFELV